MELELLFRDENVDLLEVDPQPLDVLNELDNSSQNLSVLAGSTSGGYAYQVLLRAAKEFLPTSSAEIQFKSTRFVQYSSRSLRFRGRLNVF